MKLLFKELCDNPNKFLNLVAHWFIFIGVSVGTKLTLVKITSPDNAVTWYSFNIILQTLAVIIILFATFIAVTMSTVNYSRDIYPETSRKNAILAVSFSMCFVLAFILLSVIQTILSTS